MDQDALRVAAATWPLERAASWSDYADKVAAWVARAGADLLVFPEYAGMEAALTSQPDHDLPQAWVDHAAPFAPRVRDLHLQLARRHGVHILSGSLPCRDGDRTVNRAWLCAPEGDAWIHDKQIPTPWERAQTDLAPGRPSSVSGTALGRIGVLICHDAEFPPLARALACDVLLVPACTDGPHGAARVRNAARARALEGRCHVALSQTVGDVRGCTFLDVNRGRAGLYAPPDHGLPADGIVSEGAVDVPGWTRGVADTPAIARLATLGEVDIPSDWVRAAARAALVRRGGT